MRHCPRRTSRPGCRRAAAGRGMLPGIGGWARSDASPLKSAIREGRRSGWALPNPGDWRGLPVANVCIYTIHCPAMSIASSSAPAAPTPASDSPTSQSGTSGWALMLAAAAILMVTFGVRQSIGLYISPLNTATGLGIANISLALAIGQFVWGASQPLFGALADRHGPTPVIVAGSLLLAA